LVHQSAERRRRRRHKPPQSPARSEWPHPPSAPPANAATPSSNWSATEDSFPAASPLLLQPASATPRSSHPSPVRPRTPAVQLTANRPMAPHRSEEHTSELQSL